MGIHFCSFSAQKYEVPSAVFQSTSQTFSWFPVNRQRESLWSHLWALPCLLPPHDQNVPRYKV